MVASILFHLSRFRYIQTDDIRSSLAFFHPHIMAIVVALILILFITLITYIEVKKYFINKRLHGFKPLKGIFPIIGVG